MGNIPFMLDFAFCMISFPSNWPPKCYWSLKFVMWSSPPRPREEYRLWSTSVAGIDQCLEALIVRFEPSAVRWIKLRCVSWWRCRHLPSMQDRTDTFPSIFPWSNFEKYSKSLFVVRLSTFVSYENLLELCGASYRIFCCILFEDFDNAVIQLTFSY